MRIFLDANILFSASPPGSRLADFLSALRPHAVLLTSPYAQAEAERNLAAKAPERIGFLADLAASLKLIPLDLFEIPVRLAEKDRPILCGAIAGQADFLLTGDRKDFGHLFGRTVAGVKIVTVRQLLAELIARGIVRES